MKGAVGGITLIEKSISENLSSRIIYDYRHVDGHEKISAELLEIKNHQIMFDFICARSEIVDKHTGKVADIFQSQEWALNTDIKTNITIAKKDDYEFELQPINGEQKIIKIKTFPAKILQDLLEAEYDIQLPEYVKNSKLEVEIESIASKQLRDLNIKLLELESNKQLGKIKFADQEITNIRKDFDQLSLSLFEVTSTEKSKKNTEVKNNDSNYYVFKEKLSDLSNVLSPEKIVQNLKEDIDLIYRNVQQKSEDNNKKLLLNNIKNIKKDLSAIDDTIKLKDFIICWEDLKQKNAKYVQVTGKRQKLSINRVSKKQKLNNNHLKQSEKDNLGKSNNEKNYNLSKAIKDINLDNTVLLTSIKNINRKSVIESNIIMKAFDAIEVIPDINSKELETHVKLDLILEDNHLTNHRDNISTIVKK